MRTIIITILFTVIFGHAVSAEAKDLHELGAKGYALVLDTQFDEANKIFDEIIKLEPDNALGYFLNALNYEFEITIGNSGKELEKKYITMSLEAADIAKKMLKKNKGNTDARFYLACIYGDLGLYYGATGRYLRAWWYGRKAEPNMKKVTEKDPEYYDAYLGVGLYEYLLYVLPKRVKILSFLIGDNDGDREKGIEHITLASQKGSYTRDRAKFFLADWIYFTFENNYEAASELYEELAAKYPNNHYFKMRLAVCYRNLNKYDLAVQTITSSLQTESLNKYPNIQTLLYRYLGLTYSDMNEYDKAIQTFKNAFPILESQERIKSWEYQGALYFIGDCYEMMGAIDKAHEYYSKVWTGDKSYAYTLAQARLKNPLTPAQIKLRKGSNYLRYGKYSQADAIFNELLQSESNKKPLNKTFIAELYYYLARVEYEFKEYQKSIQTFLQVLSSNDIKQDWIKPWSHYYLGNCYMNTGEIEKAKKEYEMAYEYDGNATLRIWIDKARSNMK